MADYDLYSPWVGTPNGGARYRLHLAIKIVGTNVAANQTTLEWLTQIEKDRSYRGFYWYTASWSTTINGTLVLSGSGVGSGSKPDAEWPGWSGWPLGTNRIVITMNDDGTKPNMPVSAVYDGLNSGWAPGDLVIGTVITLPAIPRATVPTVTPSTAAVGSIVTIDMPRAVGSYVHDVSWVSGTDSGSIGVGLGESTDWMVPDVMAEFPGATVAPITITVTTRNGGTVIGSNVVTLYAKEPPSAPAVNIGNDDKQFDVRARVVKYDVGTGEWRAGTYLPANTIKLVDSASATATCQVGLSKLNAIDFPDYSIIDIDVFNGNDWVYTNHRFVLSRLEGDDVDPTETFTHSGTEFGDYLLGAAYAQGDYYWDGVLDGTYQHLQPTSPGEIVRYALASFKARGWGPRIDWTFTAAKTSNGEPWTNPAVSRTIPRGTPFLQVLEGLVTDGFVEYRWEYRDDKAWLVLLNPGTGTSYGDVGADPVVNLALANLSRAPRRGTMEKRLTRVTVKGNGDLQVTRETTPFDANVFGHLEGWVTADGVGKTATANKVGDNALRDNASAVNERTFEYNSQDVPPQFYPYSVFRPGDWVLTPGASAPTKDRVSQVTIDKQVDGTRLTILTGDRILSGTASLAKRQAAQTGGAIAGGNGGTPAGLDSLIPSAPVIDEIVSEGYWTADGSARSAVTITWAAVTEAMGGQPIQVALYEVWWRTVIGGEWQLRGSTDQTTITLNNFDVLDDIELRMRARSAAGVDGEFGENQEHTTQAPGVDLDGPDIADLYTDGVGSIYIVWGGLLDGVPAPSRLAYVTAEVSGDGGATYSTMGNPIPAAGAIIVTPPAYGDYTVRLRGYDRLGNPGTASAPQEITITDPAIDPNTPLAPTGLTGTAGAGWDASGFLPNAWIDLEWDAVEEDEDGNPVAIVGYDVWGLRADESIERFLTSVGSTSARIFVGNGEEWAFRVRAASSFGGVSAPSDAFTIVADAAMPTTAAPTAPVLSQYAGLLRIQWAGGGMVPQIKYVYGSISTSPSGPWTRAGMPLLGAGEIVVPGLATETTYYAKINMVDELGNVITSPASDGLYLLPITGTTFQTSEVPNTGIKINTGGMTAYDATGAPTFILNAATGEVWIAPYEAVFDFGAPGIEAETGDPTTGLAISAEDSSFNTFVHPTGLQIRNDQTPVSWWESDPTDASLVNFVSPRARFDNRLGIGDYEALKEAKPVGSRLVFRYKGDL